MMSVNDAVGTCLPFLCLRFVKRFSLPEPAGRIHINHPICGISAVKSPPVVIIRTVRGLHYRVINGCSRNRDPCRHILIDLLQKPAAFPALLRRLIFCRSQGGLIQPALLVYCKSGRYCSAYFHYRRNISFTVAVLFLCFYIHYCKNRHGDEAECKYGRTQPSFRLVGHKSLFPSGILFPAD